MPKAQLELQAVKHFSKTAIGKMEKSFSVDAHAFPMPIIIVKDYEKITKLLMKIAIRELFFYRKGHFYFRTGTLLRQSQDASIVIVEKQMTTSKK